jgi:lipoyl-dependent peroxiredoxin
MDPGPDRRSTPAPTYPLEEVLRMPVRSANAVWNGTLREGEGLMRFGSGAFEGRYTFASRFQEEVGTNPEELIAAAHAGCFSMALSANLVKAGYSPTSVNTTARVTLENGQISLIELNTTAVVPKMEKAAFMEQAEAARTGCPVSKPFKGTEIRLNAMLED